jgi:hypothetical protein
MKNNIYYTIMSFIILAFIPLIFISKGLELNLFATQISLFFILLVFSAVTLFSLSKNLKIAWSFSIVLFSLHLMNSVYLFFFVLNVILVIYSVIALIGFVISVYNIDQKAKDHISTRIKILKKPKKVQVKTVSKKSNKTKQKKLKKSTKKKISKKKSNK